MRITRSATSALAAMAVITGVAAGTTGCASGNSANSNSLASDSPASSDPLASDSLATVINNARVNTEAVQSVHIAGWFVSSAGKESLSATVVRGQGCSATMTTEGGIGSIGLVKIGNTVWLHLPTMPTNKYMKADTSNPVVERGTSVCSLSTWLSGVRGTGNVAGTRTRTMIGTQPAVVVTVVNPSDGHNESAYVTDTIRPLVLRISEAGRALVNFTEYGATKSLTPPPSSEVVSAA